MRISPGASGNSSRPIFLLKLNGSCGSSARLGNVRLGGVVISKSLIRMEFISLTFIEYKILHVVNVKARGETALGKRYGETAR